MATRTDHRVERLRVRLSAASRHRATAVRRAVANARWPEVGGDEVVVVRHLRVCTTWAQLDDSVRVALQRAVAEGDRMRFVDGADLVAALSRDLATGTAAFHWYWQAWADLVALPASAGLARLWSRHVDLLPAVTIRLLRTGRLPAVWKALVPSHAGVAAAITARFGLQLPAGDAEPFEPLPAAAARDNADGLVLTPSIRKAARLWRSVLGAPPSSGEVALASVLLAMEHGPVHARGSDAPRLYAALAAELAGASVMLANADPQLPTRGTDPSGLAAELVGASVVLARTDAPRSDDVLDAGAIATDAPTRTAFAGVAYLVRALGCAELEPISATVLATAPNGWHLLAAVARHLGLDDEDPLAAQFAALIEEAGTASLATEAAVAPVVQKARELFGDLIWNATLLREAGWFRLQPTHLDFWLPLSAVRVELRLAGLDWNPGWCPWLGRVVTIHFVADGDSLPGSPAGGASTR